MKKRNRVVSAVSVACILLIGAVLSGCGGLFGAFDCGTERITAIQFNDDALSMRVGDSLEITSDMISVTPRFASDKDYYIESKDVRIAAVSGTRTVVAYRYGTTTLKVVSAANDSVYGECSLKVDYADPEIAIVTDLSGGRVTGDGTIVLSSASSYAAEFECDISEGSDPSLTTEWTVNGQSVEIEEQDSPTSLQYKIPAGPGEYVVRVTLPDYGLSAEQRLLSFDEPSEVSATYEGSLDQNDGDGYEAVTFTAAAVFPDGNPEPVIDWYVNDAYAYTGATFAFTPGGPGAFNVRAEVNARPAAITYAGGETDCVTVRASGSFVPDGVCVDYDNCYPDVYVTWRDPGVTGLGWAVDINGTEYRSDDPAYADRFEGTSFDASGLLDIFSGGTYRVKTLGDGDLYREGAYTAQRAFTPVPAAAESYLSDSYYDGARNYYLSNDEEFYETYAYMVLFRPDGTRSGGGVTVEKQVYLGYDTNHESVESLMNTAFYLAHFTGEYTNYFSGSQADRGVHTLKVTCYSDNAPSVYNTGDSDTGLNAVRPHVNMTDDKIADSFPIDDNYPVSVYSSEELYYVAEKGFRPVPETGSPAADIYDSARKVLMDIIPPEYLPLDPDAFAAQKAHAVYDWIMWRVSYDFEATETTDISRATKIGAYYLEDVLGEGEPKAVCDGMSKAYSLLMNMLGIPCVRVAGTAYSGGAWGGHAWNKVKLPGGWYNVDCTWGDGLVQYEEQRGSFFPWGPTFSEIVTKEKATHDYLFLTDAEIRADHREDTPNDYPPSADIPYNWFNEKTYHNGRELDFYLMTAATVESEVQAIVGYLIDTMPDDGGAYTIAGVSVEAGYYGADIRIASSINDYATADKIKGIAEDYLLGSRYEGKFRYLQTDAAGEYGILMLKY